MHSSVFLEWMHWYTSNDIHYPHLETFSITARRNSIQVAYSRKEQAITDLDVDDSSFLSGPYDSDEFQETVLAVKLTTWHISFKNNCLFMDAYSYKSPVVIWFSLHIVCVLLCVNTYKLNHMGFMKQNPPNYA